MYEFIYHETHNDNTLNGSRRYFNTNIDQSV